MVSGLWNVLYMNLLLWSIVHCWILVEDEQSLSSRFKVKYLLWFDVMFTDHQILWERYSFSNLKEVALPYDLSFLKDSTSVYWKSIKKMLLFQNPYSIWLFTSKVVSRYSLSHVQTLYFGGKGRNLFVWCVLSHFSLSECLYENRKAIRLKQH